MSSFLAFLCQTYKSIICLVRTLKANSILEQADLPERPESEEAALEAATEDSEVDGKEFDERNLSHIVLSLQIQRQKQKSQNQRF